LCRARGLAQQEVVRRKKYVRAAGILSLSQIHALASVHLWNSNETFINLSR
jgi:hypothetical protein